jgi:hypothetical protein
MKLSHGLILAFLRCILTYHERAKIIIVMWSIWYSRNKWKHDEVHIDPVFSVTATRESLFLLDIPCQQIVLPGHGWHPPGLIHVKINTCGAINFADGNGGAGLYLGLLICSLQSAWQCVMTSSSPKFEGSRM